MPNLEWNHNIWNEKYNWDNLGEEWSDKFGGSEAQWFGSILPRIHRFLPAKNTLEISPGFGRWTNYLLNNTENYVGVDLSAKCINHCINRFSKYNNAKFYVNDGMSLDMIEDGIFDFIFSFDSLVHANLEVHKSYIPQIISKLSSGGFAFVHHSNFIDSGAPAILEGQLTPHSRGEDVGATIYSEIVKQSGGQIILQEVINWGEQNVVDYTIDALTIFSKKNTNTNPIFIENKQFHLEKKYIRDVQSFYSKIN